MTFTLPVLAVLALAALGMAVWPSRLCRRFAAAVRLSLRLALPSAVGLAALFAWQPDWAPTSLQQLAEFLEEKISWGESGIGWAVLAAGTVLLGGQLLALSDLIHWLLTPPAPATSMASEPPLSPIAAKPAAPRTTPKPQPAAESRLVLLRDILRSQSQS
jgi:hypothetical protein